MCDSAFRDPTGAALRWFDMEDAMGGAVHDHKDRSRDGSDVVLLHHLPPLSEMTALPEEAALFARAVAAAGRARIRK
jgi:hypothetical protein